MVLYDAVETHEIAVDVVEDFNRCGLGAEEEQGSAAGEDFDVALVGREQGDEAVGQAAFSAHPGDDGIGHGKPSLRVDADDRLALGVPASICENGWRTKY